MAELPSLSDYEFNGKAVLESVLCESIYQTVAQAVASLTKFSHPDTVAQTHNRNLFRTMLTDTDIEICALLRYRAFDLFGGFKPQVADEPQKPCVYDKLTWAEPLPLVTDVETQMRRAISTKPKDRVVKSIRELGWYFSDYQPDRS